MAVSVDSATARYSDLCRLCATKIGAIQGLNIFATDASYRQIFKKIQACLPLQISESDFLPKMVCENCLYKVELLFDFRERALRTEGVLIELFKQLHDHHSHQPHPMQMHHTQTPQPQHMKLDALDHVISQAQPGLLNSLSHVNDIDLPQISHRESMIILQHNVPLDQLSQHDINQELSNHSIDAAESILSGNTYNTIEYQQHHMLSVADDISLHNYSVLNHEHELKNVDNNVHVNGIQRLMMNEAHFMHDNLNVENIDAILPTIFCNSCGKSFEDKLALHEHYLREHYKEISLPHSNLHEKELENMHRKELHGSTIDQQLEQISSPELKTNHEHDEMPKTDPSTLQPCVSAPIAEVLENLTISKENSTFGLKIESEQFSDIDSGDSSDIIDNNCVEITQEPKNDENLTSSANNQLSTSSKHKKQTPLCDVCGKEYKSNYKLRQHMRKHTGEQPYKCNSCDKAFRSKIGLAQHEATHTGQWEYLCKTCGKGFQCRSYLMVHQRVHSDVKPFACDTCEMSFKTKQGLVDHTNRHLGVKPYACKQCDRSFITNALLKAHEKTHSGMIDRRYECTVCNKMFVSKSYLRIHSRIHTGEKPFKCEVCGKGFLAKVDLRVHSTLHTGEKSFVCEICGKAFARRDALRCHRRMHTGERPYKCEFCGQTFTQFSPMAIHKRSHTGERPYECEVCGDKFVSRSTMIAHSKKHAKTKEKEMVKKKKKKCDDIIVGMP